MKGLLGRKVGMTSVFTDHGRNIPVTVVEVKPNVVTAALTNEKNGYVATQLAAFDKRESATKKPELGHFKKATTNPKYFVKEIKGMSGHKIGTKLDVSLFAPGELVDVVGTSKGKGFQGTIKRHNQKIGPKSHGGGGGSKPVRLTGSLGDLVSNRVFKGMTMPGQMGNEQVTVQNLEIVSVDKKNNLLLVKGSIPGPNKSYVVVKEAVKGLATREAIKLVDVQEAEIKNKLIEESKKFGVNINTDMSVHEMEQIIEDAKAAKAEEEAKAKAAEEAAKAKAAAEAKAKAEEKKAAETKEATKGDK